METEKFKILVKDFIEHEEALLGTKREDYTKGDKDCLINFKEASAMLGMNPQFYCATLFMKHFHSVLNAVKKGWIKPTDWVWSGPQGEGLKQHLADARNFLLLLAALIQDEQDIASGKTIVIEDDGEID